jgi:DNA end-binding protein Ku
VPLPFFAKPYLLAPVKGSEKPYRLLLEALDDAERLAIGDIVVRTRQYTCAVYPYEGVLVAHLLRYAEELRTPSDLGVRAPSAKLRPEETKLAKTLIASMDTEWDADAHRDTFRREVLALIRRRAKQGTRKAKAAPRRRGGGEEPTVLDLVAALKRSVGTGGGTAKKRSAKGSRRSSAKRSA